MRLNKLHIKTRFKNLDDFFIDFDQSSTTTVLVGQNGTGKSNLLEALTIIFRDLDLGESPAFSYNLDYICRDKNVSINADPKNNSNKGYKITVNGESASVQNISNDPFRKYLPNYVFGYYSGSSNRMEDLFRKHQQKFYQELLENKEKPLRPLFFARPVHSHFVLLAFFMEEDNEIKNFLSNELRIEGLDYVMFVMREPPWKSKVGDERFWRARGVVSDFLDILYANAMAPLRRTKSVQVGFRKSKKLEHLYLFLPDLKSIRKLANKYHSNQDFFKVLESTYISELISEVAIRVRSKKNDRSITFREMSEGEQQLLMVLGLLRFTREDESLFLLDEPDTHLNPNWSVQYLDFLKKVGGTQKNSHIIMATHDPLVIAGLTRSQVQIMQRNDEIGRITATIPEKDPKGMGVAGLLTSDVYGMRSQLDLDTLKLLDRKRELATKNSLSVKEKNELRKLTNSLWDLDFTNIARDPLFNLFTQQMAKLEKEEKLQQPILSPLQMKKQRELAVEILKKLKGKKIRTK